MLRGPCVGCPFDTRSKDTERTKIEKYTDLKYELLKVWKGDVSALGTMTNNVQKNLDLLNIGSKVGDVQKIGRPGTARILRKVLDT